MKVRPFLYFYGNCQEALNLYEKAFGVEASGVLRFFEAYTIPEAGPVPENQKNWICNASIRLGNSTIRLADSRREINTESSSRVCIEVEDSIEKITHAFSVLEEEGSVIHPLRQAIFGPPFHGGDCHGSVADKFGVRWELSSIGWDSLYQL